MNATILLSGILDRNAPLKVVDALLLALIGICIVFCVLILLMLLVQIEGMIFEKSDKLRQKHPEWAQKVLDVKQKMAFWKKTKTAQPSKKKTLRLQTAPAESSGLSTQTSVTPQ